MKDILPPLRALRAFEATARHASVTLAADELHVTPGAVSLQIRELESTLGVHLFTRRPRRMALTPIGERYFPAVRDAFRTIRAATTDVIAQSQLQVITITCTPSIAVQWLVPRLRILEERMPEVDIRVSPSNRLMDFSRDAIDLAIRHSAGRHDGLTSEKLFDDKIMPACSPALLDRLGPISQPGDLRRFPLLHCEDRQEWRQWLDIAGAGDVDASHGPIFTNSNGEIEAAKAGLGVVLVRLSLIERELAEGVLVAPLPVGLASGMAYYLVYPPEALDQPTVRAVRDWLVDEAKVTADRVVVKRTPRRPGGAMDGANGETRTLTPFGART